jgi:MarR family 2-MHQ and catechol resistance regulon transcriptional repressor
MTAAVDRLERGGLVKRADAVTDRRSRIVHLTAEGTKLGRRIFAEHARDMEQAFSCLAEPEREALVGLLRKLGRGAETAPRSSRGIEANREGDDLCQNESKY